MTGFLLLGVAIFWLVAALFITKVIFRKLRTRRWCVPLAVVLFLALVPLPLVDEIVGGKQFALLCNEALQVKVDAEKAQGRSVELRQIPHLTLPGHTTIPRRNIPSAMVAIREDSWEYVDINSHEVLLSFKTYDATGGWLIRTLGISEGNAPLTFPGYCGPKNESTIFAELGIKKIDRSAATKRDKK